MQENPGTFKAVGGDMKVEQSIQKVSKGPGGHYVVGETRKHEAVAEFELLYHEIGAIANLLGFLTADTSEHLECNLQSCFSKSRRLTFNMNVIRLLGYILSRQNPYSMITALVPLHNILNKQAVHPTVAKQMLQCLEHGRKAYKLHRHERYVTKEKKISATISRRKLPSFRDDQKMVAKTKALKSSPKSHLKK